MPNDAKPVAWMYEHTISGKRLDFYRRELTPVSGWTETPLYAHPPAPAQPAPELVEVTPQVIEMAETLRNHMHDGGWGLDAYAGDWRSDHPILQILARLTTPAPAQPAPPEIAALIYSSMDKDFDRRAALAAMPATLRQRIFEMADAMLAERSRPDAG